MGRPKTHTAILFNAPTETYEFETRHDQQLLVAEFFFMDDPFSDKEVFDKFLSLVELGMPELYPQKYGQTEPLRFNIKKWGEDHFYKVARNFNSIGSANVMWTTRIKTFAGSLSINRRVGWRRSNFKVNGLTIWMNRSVLRDNVSPQKLIFLWQGICRLLNVFYAEIRALKNHAFFSNGEPDSARGVSDVHPVLGNWWNGIPYSLPLAVAIGSEYLPHWPEFNRLGDGDDQLKFLVVSDLEKEDSIAPIVGAVPKEIAIVREPEWDLDPTGVQHILHREEMPKIFPLGDLNLRIV